MINPEKEPFNPVFKHEDVSRFFKSAEEKKREELEEKGPIFHLTKTENVDGKEVERKYVSVAGIELEVNQEGEGTLFKEEEFKDFSLDKKSLELIKIYVQAIKLNQPVLVEGETDIGKTKALEYLSYLANTRLKRISLSGQTDVTEFIGKYVPNIEGAQRLFEKTLENRSKLRKKSLEVLEKTEQEKRGLTEEESKEIAKIEGIHLENVNWVWQDGEIPQAMRGNGDRGVWLYFDELGAAEPSVLVKTNRVFERYGRLELSENGGRLIEAGPDFRILASTNPPEYAGRQPFAPDYIRRFAYQKVGLLDVDTLRDRTACIFRQKKTILPPDIYHLSTEAPVNLEVNQEVSEILENALIEFHTAASKQLEAGLGKDQNQQFRYEFSDIIRVKDYLNKLQEVDLMQTFKNAIEFYYVNKLGNEDAREKLKQVFQTTLRLHKTEEKLSAAIKKMKQQGVPAEIKESSIETREKEAKEEGVEFLPLGQYNVVFNQGLDSMGKPGFINKIPGRKAIVLDRLSPIKPETGMEYRIRVVKETFPGEHKGVFFATILDKSPHQKLKEEMAKQNYEFSTNIGLMKTDESGKEVRRSNEEILEYAKDGFTSETDEMIINRHASDNMGNPISSCVSVWRKSREDKKDKSLAEILMEEEERREKFQKKV